MSEYDIDKLPPLSADNPSILGDVHMKVNEIITDLHHDHYTAATATAPGLMTAADKAKLDGMSGSSQPPMWVRLEGLPVAPKWFIGPGVTADGPTVGSWTSCHGVRAVQLYNGYVSILPLNPGMWTNANSLGALQYFGSAILNNIQWEEESGHSSDESLYTDDSIFGVIDNEGDKITLVYEGATGNLVNGFRGPEWSQPPVEMDMNDREKLESMIMSNPGNIQVCRSSRWCYSR